MGYVCRVILYSIRGTAELIGIMVFLSYLIGIAPNGKWALYNFLNVSISKNGLLLTVMLLLFMFLLGAIYKSKCFGERP